MRIKYKINSQDLASYYEHSSKNSPFFQKLKSKLQGLSLILSAFLAIVMFFVASAFVLVIIVLGIIVFAAAPWIQKWILKRHLKKAAKRSHSDFENTEIEVEIREEGLWSKAGQSEFTKNFDEIVEISEDGGNTYIIMEDGSGLIFPEDSVDAAEKQQMIAELQKKMNKTNL